MSADRSSPPSPETPPFSIAELAELCSVTDGTNVVHDTLSEDLRAKLVQMWNEANRAQLASPRSSLTAPTELKEALDELEKRAKAEADRNYNSRNRSEGTERLTAARSKVEEMYKALQEQVAISNRTGYAMCDALNRLRRERDELLKQVQNQEQS